MKGSISGGKSSIFGALRKTNLADRLLRLDGSPTSLAMTLTEVQELGG